MIRVLEVVGRMERAGQESFLMNIFRARDKEKYDISFSVNTNHIGAYEEEIVASGGAVYHNPYSADIKNIFKYIKSFRKILRENGPFDAVHCHVWLFGGFIMQAAKKEKVPIRIMHSHSTVDGYNNSFFRRLYRFTAKKLIDSCSTEKVACGRDAYRALFDKECENDNLILNNSVDISLFDDTAVDSNALKSELGIPLNTTVFVSVARFCKVKNHRKIINIFNEYHKKNKNSVLLLVGDGELKSQILSQVKELGIEDAVIFMGVRSDVNKILFCSDVFLMPSEFEGLPVSLVEAQAAGVSCVISESITDEIDMGLSLIKKADINSDDKHWVNLIEEALTQDKPEFILRKRKLFEHGYTVESTWRKLDLIYDRKNSNN